MRTIRHFTFVIHQTPASARASNQAPPPRNDKYSWIAPIVAAIIAAIATVTSAFVTAQSKVPPAPPPTGYSAAAPHAISPPGGISAPQAPQPPVP